MKENLRMSRDGFLRMNGIKSLQITIQLNQVRLLYLGKLILCLFFVVRFLVFDANKTQHKTACCELGMIE